MTSSGGGGGGGGKMVYKCTSCVVVGYHILHDEVNQTLLKVGSCPLLEVDRTATSTLRG